MLRAERNELPRIVGADGLSYEEWSARREAQSKPLTEADVRRIARDEATKVGCFSAFWALMISLAVALIVVGMLDAHGLPPWPAPF